MKKGLIGPFQLGMLSAGAEALELASGRLKQPGTDLEGLFFATAFQAGVDRFVLTLDDPELRPKTAFIADRTSYLKKGASEENWEAVGATFDHFLPSDWYRQDQYRELAWVQIFLVDLMDAMAAGTSLLSASGVPDLTHTRVKVPSELALPLTSLLACIEDLEVPGLIAQKALSRDSFRRYSELMMSDLFSRYSRAHEGLDEAELPLSAVLPEIRAAGRSMRLRSSSSTLLAVRTSGIGLLELTPKVIDSVFGALPGVLADFASKLGLKLLESRRRVVIYDLSSTFESLLRESLHRMVDASLHAADLGSGHGREA